ncbi:MAG: hypothetical protein KKC11_05955 [Candidatus Omnitrophica bacterium]|nr:hypothetical protein [Candidatus Omnitrophota bacterium]MBU0878852.1 hypothetical protein [Candidatus Omnitrophota bacterium]MBU0897138.1 hypothetical protein [Candidatus Omnitrophota bacterium]MBU1809894.1 hypothetical protein [Candidatus Omnitrophota bacterium]
MPDYTLACRQAGIKLRLHRLIYNSLYLTASIEDCCIFPACALRVCQSDFIVFGKTPPSKVSKGSIPMDKTTPSKVSGGSISVNKLTRQ